MNKRVALSELSPVITEVLQNDGEVIFTVTGVSMLPMLRHRRDKVSLVGSREGRLRKYDLVLFVRPGGKYILHRIVAVKEAGYVMIGDNQYAKEYPVRLSQVVGVVKGFWRNGKYISCDNFIYCLYCRFWVWSYPLRSLYSKCRQGYLKLFKKYRYSDGTA